MENLTPRQQQIVKFAVGLATVLLIGWFLLTSRVVETALQPSVDAGKLGNPAVSGAVVLLTQVLVAIGGWMIVMSTSLWKFAANKVAPLVASEAGDISADEFVENAIGKPSQLSGERRAMLEEAVLITIENRDSDKLIQCAELLAGEPFFPQTEAPQLVDNRKGVTNGA